MQFDDAGQRYLALRGPRQIDWAAARAQMLRQRRAAGLGANGQQQVFNGGGTAEAQGVAQLRRLSRLAVVARQQGEADQPCVACLGLGSRLPRVCREHLKCCCGGLTSPRFF